MHFAKKTDWGRQNSCIALWEFFLADYFYLCRRILPFTQVFSGLLRKDSNLILEENILSSYWLTDPLIFFHQNWTKRRILFGFSWIIIVLCFSKMDIGVKGIPVNISSVELHKNALFVMMASPLFSSIMSIIDPFFYKISAKYLQQLHKNITLL